MRIKPLVFGLLLVWGVGATTELFACGNKFLSPSRGNRFGKGVVREASILLYANPETSLTRVLGEVPVEDILREAGYSSKTVTSMEELDLALRQGGWDLVLADLEDSAPIGWRFEGEGTPTVLPVMYQPARSDFSQAKKDYGRVLKAPFKSMRLIETVDDAVARHFKTRSDT
jgi:DNA-binding NtrC family response regulator